MRVTKEAHTKEIQEGTHVWFTFLSFSVFPSFASPSPVDLQSSRKSTYVSIHYPHMDMDNDTEMQRRIRERKDRRVDTDMKAWRQILL